MPSMNRQWAINKLQDLLATAEIKHVPSPPGVIGAGSYRFLRPEAEVQAAAQIAEQILDRIVPDWRTAQWEEPYRRPMWRHREASHRAIAQLEAEQELIENLGSGAPQLDAATLHPWVWGSVQGLWGSGHYREAVGAAARAINAHAQSKLGRRDALEAKLLSDAFSANPPSAGHPRLRLGSNDGGETFKNRQDGAGNFARGVYSAIRNPLAHENDVELSENEALEQLAAFSILARWIDAASIETAT
jgi:uncharacterized protein (TIGR02391 family)